MSLPTVNLKILKIRLPNCILMKSFFRKKRVLREKAELWDYLDQCGVQFRTLKSELIKLYGSRNCGWADYLEYCELGNGSPVFRKLAILSYFNLILHELKDFHRVVFIVTSEKATTHM